MSSIGAGICSGLDIKEDTSGKVHTDVCMCGRVSKSNTKDKSGLLLPGCYFSIFCPSLFENTELWEHWDDFTMKSNTAINGSIQIIS